MPPPPLPRRPDTYNYLSGRGGGANCNVLEEVKYIRILLLILGAGGWGGGGAKIENLVKQKNDYIFILFFQNF